MLNESSLIHVAQAKDVGSVSNVNVRWKRLILLLLLVLSNVQPNPGPAIITINTPDEFKTRSGLGILHINSHRFLFRWI